ncbi:MAG: hypothetical protein HRU44_03230 [Candidatus Thalassarchaeum sp.]|nr:hypothetical protein [Candidatus Thalassarchaeum sp.]
MTPIQRLSNAGYHSCPCRDCFEIAIGCDDNNNPDMCGDCEDAGCDGTGECDSPTAYGMEA